MRDLGLDCMIFTPAGYLLWKKWPRDSKPLGNTSPYKVSGSTQIAVPHLRTPLMVGLKTRQWAETKAALENLVSVARQARESVAA
jgi:hypothetical protein